MSLQEDEAVKCAFAGVVVDVIRLLATVVTALALASLVLCLAVLLLVCSRSVMTTKSVSREELFRSTKGRAMLASGTRWAMLLMTKKVRKSTVVARFAVSKVVRLDPVWVVAARL